MPVFDMIETCLVKKYKFKPSTKLRFTTRTLYVGKNVVSSHRDRLNIGVCIEKKDLWIHAYFPLQELQCSLAWHSHFLAVYLDSLVVLLWLQQHTMWVLYFIFLFRVFLNYPGFFYGSGYHIARLSNPFDTSTFLVHIQLPCIMWLIIKKPKRFSLSWCMNWVCYIKLLYVIPFFLPLRLAIIILNSRISDLHRLRGSVDDSGTHWWIEEHNFVCKQLQILPMRFYIRRYRLDFSAFKRDLVICSIYCYAFDHVSDNINKSHQWFRGFCKFSTNMQWIEVLMSL